MKKSVFAGLFAAVFSLFLLCSCASSGAAVECAPAAKTKKVRIGLYVDKGANGNGVFHLASLIAHSPQTELVTLMAKDIQEGKLNTVDVLLMPGGGSYEQCAAIGKAHHDKIRDFLRKGGAFVGTCAGMFNVLGCRLKLLPFDRYNGAGGSTAHVTVEVSKEGAKVLGIAPGNRVVRYSGGPLAYPTDPAKCEGKGISLGAYKSSVSRSTKHLDKFIGSSGWIYGTFGKGKIIATSFHPEYWDSTHDMMLGCFYAVTGVKMTPVFPKKNRRPLRVGIYSVGINGHDVIKTMLDLERHPDIDLHYVMTAEVNQGLLRHLDYFVMPNGVGNFIKKYANRPFTKKVLKDFVDRGGIILAGGNAAKALPDHKNIKKLPAKVDFKKYILK